MFRSIQQFNGDKLLASDGEIGHVNDFYFDDKTWTVRYVVADTGSWLRERQVLLSPYSFEPLDPAIKAVRVNLTRQQIEESPVIPPRKALSRQEQDNYHQHFGWPRYWQADPLSGISPFPVVEPAEVTLMPEQPLLTANQGEDAQAHLKSTKAVNGYHLLATDGLVGHVCDFMIDPETWVIHHLVIKTGHRLSGIEVLVSTSHVDRVSYNDSTISVSLTRDAILAGPSRPLTGSAEQA